MIPRSNPDDALVLRPLAFIPPPGAQPCWPRSLSRWQTNSEASYEAEHLLRPSSTIVTDVPIEAR